MIYNNKSTLNEKFRSVTESASSEDTDTHTRNKSGLAPLSVSDFVSDDLGMARSEELANDPVYGNFFRDPIVMETLTKYYDLSDSKTRKAILSMNEAEQASILTSLTSKLYDNLVSKVDDIDYGDIPMSKGDITKVSNYEKMEECISLLRKIVKEYHQDTAPIDELSLAIANIRSRKDLFNRAFRLNIEMPIITYNTMVLGVIIGVSYMVSTCIEFIKTPNKDTFDITLDKMAYAKSKNHLVYTNLKAFNKACSKGDFDKAMNHIIDGYVKNEGAAIAGLATAIVGKVTLTKLIMASVLLIIPILRMLIFFAFYLSMKVSEFFEVQADLLQINAQNIESDPNLNDEQKKKVTSSQMKIVGFFRNIANKLAINGKKAEVESTKEIEKEDKDKDKIDGSGSVLF